MANRYCEKCQKMLNEKEFYYSHNIERYPDGKLNQCKKCITMHLDNWEPDTFLWILEEIDVPYIKEVWDSILEKWSHDPKGITTMTILGRYLATMKLRQWNKYRWKDTKELADAAYNAKVSSMVAQGIASADIETQLAIDHTPPKPVALPPPEEDLPDSLPIDTTLDKEREEFIKSLDQELTTEDKTYLRKKWGRDYRLDELVRMEQFYNDMMASYDIQGAGHQDTLIMICKASLKANQCIDSGDIDSFQKIQKAYDSLMKSGKFQAIQNKESMGEGIDSIGEIVALCERDKFIPRFYIDKPNDKIDRIIQDMQEYTRDLVTEELGLENLIQNSLRALEEERAAIAAAAADENSFEQQQEDKLFNYDGNILEDADFMEFIDFEEDDEDGTS